MRRYFLYFFSFLCISLFAFGDALGQEGVPNILSDAQLNQTQMVNGVEKKQSLERGLLTKDKGLSPFYDTDFASFRMLSCDGGIPQTNQLFLMIEAKIKNGWKLKKPIIPYETTNSYIEKEEIFYPINTKAIKRTTHYERDAYFALLYTLKEGTQSFNVKKDVSFTACQKEKCETKIIPLELMLNRSYAHSTDVCAMMLAAFQNVPTPPENDELKAKLIKIDDDYLQLLLDFKRDVNRINIQIETDKNWQLVKEDMRDNQAILLIKSQELVQLDKLNIKLATSVGAFDLNLPVEQGEWKALKKELSIFEIIKAGLGLFFLSPLFLIFLCLPDEKKQLLENVKHIKYGIISLAVVCAVLGYFYIDIFNFFEIRNWNVLFAFAGIIYLLHKPNIPLKWAIVFFFLLPKPYLMDVLYSLDRGQISIFFVFAVWAFISYLPFNITKNTPQLFQAIRTVKQYAYLLRVPQALLLIWLLVAVGGHFVFDKGHTFNEDTFSHKNQITYISIENGYCVRCLLNKWSVRYLADNTNLLLDKNVNIVSLSVNSVEGKNFLSTRHLEQATFGLLFGPKKPYPLVVYGYVSLDEWPDYLKNVTKIADINKQFIAGKDGEQ